MRRRGGGGQRGESDFNSQLFSLFSQLSFFLMLTRFYAQYGEEGRKEGVNVNFN